MLSYQLISVRLNMISIVFWIGTPVICIYQRLQKINKKSLLLSYGSSAHKWMSFGFCNASAIFQMCIMVIFFTYWKKHWDFYGWLQCVWLLLIITVVYYIFFCYLKLLKRRCVDWTLRLTCLRWWGELC